MNATLSTWSILGSTTRITQLGIVVFAAYKPFVADRFVGWCLLAIDAHHFYFHKVLKYARTRSHHHMIVDQNDVVS